MLQGPPAAPCAPARVFLALYPCFTCSLCLPRPFYMFYTTCAGSAGWRSDCVFYRCLCSFALCYRNGNIFMYVFMKLQHHGRALLAFSGEWEGAGGRRGEEEQQTVGPKSHFPRPLLELGLVGGLRAGGCSALCSMQQHSADIPSREWRRAPWCHLTAAVTGGATAAVSPCPWCFPRPRVARPYARSPGQQGFACLAPGLGGTCSSGASSRGITGKGDPCLINGTSWCGAH